MNAADEGALAMAMFVLDAEVRLLHEDLPKAVAGSLYRENSTVQWAVKAFHRANKILDMLEGQGNANHAEPRRI